MNDLPRYDGLDATAGSRSSPPSDDPYRSIDDVPWFRRSPFVSVLVLFGLCCGPAVLAACVIVLTGDVYFPTHDKAGNLKRWGVANKFAAVVILALNVVGTAVVTK